MTGAITAAVIAVVGTAANVASNRKARKSQERASRVQQKIESRGAQRDRLSQLRQAQIARAAAIQGAVNSGTADSSGLSGQLAGMQATTAGNLAFSQQTETGVGVINMYNRQAAKYQSQAANYGAVANLALSSMSFTGGGGSPNKPSAPSNNPGAPI